MSQSIYGGKIDNDFDQRLLHSFLTKLFTPRSFESDFALVANIDGGHITMPDGSRRDHFLKWIESLADRQTPAWLGLPNNAEKVLLTTRGTDLIGKLLKMQQLEVRLFRQIRLLKASMNKKVTTCIVEKMSFVFIRHYVPIGKVMDVLVSTWLVVLLFGLKTK